MKAVPAEGQTEPRVAYGRLTLLSVSHLCNDLFGNVMTSLTPYLVLRGTISTAMTGVVLLVYLFGSSVLQPLFGLSSDRSGRRLFVILGPLWVGIAASLFGWAPNDLALLGLGMVGGIGTAAFHPQAASMVDQVSPRNKGWTMAIFSMGGNIGFALGPLVAAAIATAGLHWTTALVFPGLLLSALLFRWAPAVGTAGAQVDLRSLRDAAVRSGRSLALIVTVIATRSGAQYVLIIFLPLYYHARGFPAQLGSYYAFVLSLSGAVGGLLGGHLSDRYGRRPVVVGSLLISAPLLFLSLTLTGPIVWPLLAVSGAALLASNSVTVVQGQERLPANTGIASGLTMGLGFGLSGVITTTETTLSVHTGITAVLYTVPFLALGAAAVGAFVPDRPAVFDGHRLPDHATSRSAQ